MNKILDTVQADIDKAKSVRRRSRTARSPTATRWRSSTASRSAARIESSGGTRPHLDRRDRRHADRTSPSRRASAEAAGIDCIWTPELFRSSVTQATWLAAKTEKDRASAPASPGPSPAAPSSSPSAPSTSTRWPAAASGSASAPGCKRLNETWHSVDYGKPAPHLRETIEATRLIMEKASTGEPIRYEGEYQDIDIRGWIRPHKPVRDRGPDLHRGDAGGDVPDGGRRCRRADRPPDVPGAVARRGDDPEPRDGSVGAPGEQRSDLDFIPTIATVIDDDESRALDAARRTIAFYSTVRTYKPLWEMHGFADAAEAAGDAFRKGDLAAVPEQIPDEMVDAYTAAGPLDKVRARVEPRSPSAATASCSPRRPTSSRRSRSASTRPDLSRRSDRPESAVALNGRPRPSTTRPRSTPSQRLRSRVPEWGAVAEADQLRLERRELPGRLPVSRRVRRQGGLRLVEPRDPRVLVHIGQDVADDQDPVGLPPEDHMSGACARARRSP